jgi:hypothetical protein
MKEVSFHPLSNIPMKEVSFHDISFTGILLKGGYFLHWDITQGMKGYFLHWDITQGMKGYFLHWDITQGRILPSLGYYSRDESPMKEVSSLE